MIPPKFRARAGRVKGERAAPHADSSTGLGRQGRAGRARDQVDVIAFQLQAAKAAQIDAKIARDAEVGGENPAVAQIMAQLENGKWELEQTWITSPERW